MKLVEEDEPYKPAFLELPQMVKYGVTVGVAAAFHTSAGWGQTDQSNLGVSAMPYVAVVPGYWALGGVSAEYCAAQALTLSWQAAQEAADGFAERRARKAWNAAIERDPKTLAGALTAEGYNTLAAAASTATKFEDLAGDRDDAIEYFSGWKRGVRGRCAATWFGVYFGVPFSYSANFAEPTESMGNQHVTREARARGSVGIVIAPFPYVNLLAGLTSIVTEVPVGEGEDAPSRQKPSWQFTLGIGGTLDLIGAALEAIK